MRENIHAKSIGIFGGSFVLHEQFFISKPPPSFEYGRDLLKKKYLNTLPSFDHLCMSTELLADKGHY
jgi:hypothetical protein